MIDNIKDGWLMVEVPENAMVEFSIDRFRLCYQIPPNTSFNDPMWSIDLPSGTWQIHSDSTTITEEQAAEIVDKVHIKNPEEWAYKNYVDGFKLDKIGVTVGYSRAIDSYESLLQSMGLEGKRVVNLKRI